MLYAAIPLRGGGYSVLKLREGERTLQKPKRPNLDICQQVIGRYVVWERQQKLG